MSIYKNDNGDIEYQDSIYNKIMSAVDVELHALTDMITKEKPESMDKRVEILALFRFYYTRLEYELLDVDKRPKKPSRICKQIKRKYNL